jgi:hypothetical protein
MLLLLIACWPVVAWLDGDVGHLFNQQWGSDGQVEQHGVFCWHP